MGHRDSARPLWLTPEQMKTLIKILLGIFTVIMLSLILPYDIYFLWNRPIEYTGKSLSYHHSQLTQQGFSFVAKADKWGWPEYLYVKKSFLGRKQYILLERKYDSATIYGATKCSPSLYSSSMGIRYSRELSDDFPINTELFLSSIKECKLEPTEDEFFLKK